MTIDRQQSGRYVNPYTDFGFKWLFGTEVNKELLIDFLNALLKLDSPICDITCKDVESLNDNLVSRSPMFDVYCESMNGTKFVVEMLKRIENFSIDRSIYYASFPISYKVRRLQSWGFNLKAVNTVGILDFTFKDENDDKYYHEVKLIDTTTKKVFYDKLTFVYLEMPKFNKNIGECDTLLDKWMYVLKNMTRLLERPVELQQRIFDKLFKTAEVATFDETQRAQYEDSLKVYRDWKNVISSKERKGRAEGIAEGRAEGIALGRAEGIAAGRAEGEAKMREAAAKMKRSGMSVEQIHSFTGLTIDEIEGL